MWPAKAGLRRKATDKIDTAVRFLRGHWQLVLITLLVFVLWNTPIVLPLKILVVFLHEFSHALAVVLTGGSVESFSISLQQGGHVTARGGSRFLTLSAGYLGSLALGMALLIIALRTRSDRAVLGVFGGVMLLVTLLYIRDPFPMIFCAGVGVAMLAMARYLDRAVCDLVLRIIGLTSMIYVPYDIFDDTLRRPGVRSDAFMLAEEFGGTTMMWGGVWLVLSCVAIFVCLKYWLGQNSNLRFSFKAR
ncbi:M50 family metallopeptidase [Rhodobacteraceae bacterium B1Z28]|uniref:M50 family metallopeptidase n=1 Tax=Ruegeria haliotis TaxID=2747601 RepID=A0ABX2PN60_9RHOB|nr:M50 family metallopeptidase [Ruegeria haliotis]NVO55575.1 M50 family metallopeptidase [Ruegeria haliotis]